MSTRYWQAEVLPAAATLSVRQLITAAESGKSSSSNPVWGSPGPDTELPDRHCSWSRQQPELSINCLLHDTSQTTPPSPTLSPRLRSAATQHLGTPSGMSQDQRHPEALPDCGRGGPLPSLGTSHKAAHQWSGMDTGPVDVTFQGRQPAPESLQLCNKVNLPHCLVSSTERLSIRKVYLWTPENRSCGLPKR